MPEKPLTFLLSPRWIAFALFVLVLSGVCLRLGAWQMQRHDERRTGNEVIKRHLTADPVALDTVEAVDDGTEWTLVRVTGTYDVDEEVTVTFTTRDGAPGVDVVTPLVLPDESAVLVDRGWLATENNSDRPENIPAPPTGDVTVTGWLRQDSGADDDAITPRDGKVRAISSVGMAPSVPYELRSGYLNVRDQQPPATTSLELEPEPELGQGPHFFYGLQWWFFGLLAPVGYVWFARDELRARRNPATPEPTA